MGLVLASHGSKAFAAINRAVLAGLKGNLRFFAAVGADRGVHLAVRLRRSFAGVTAGFAALGLVHKALFRVELLLTGGENEFRAALVADQSLVFVH